jgi:rhodanese-related sulfurtransferase
MKTKPRWSLIGRDLGGMWLLATASLATGFLINQFRDKPLPLIYAGKKERLDHVVADIAPALSAPGEPPSTVSVAPDVSTAGPVVISLPEFRQIVDGHKSIILDARPEIFHRFGHVPGAISLSREEFERDYAKNKSLLADHGRCITVYCSSSSCEDSDMVAGALVKLGYTNVEVFKGGWDEWSGAGLPQEGKSE